GPAVVNADFAFAITCHDLAEQRDFLGAARRQLAAFGDNIGNRSASFLAACVGHDAKGAVLVAALHDADEGSDGLGPGVAGQNVFANGRLTAGFLRDVTNLV